MAFWIRVRYGKPTVLGAVIPEVDENRLRFSGGWETDR
jgi:hypothetical protein